MTTNLEAALETRAGHQPRWTLWGTETRQCRLCRSPWPCLPWLAARQHILEALSAAWTSR